MNIQKSLIMSLERLAVSVCEDTSFQKQCAELDSQFIFADPRHIDENMLKFYFGIQYEVKSKQCMLMSRHQNRFC